MPRNSRDELVQLLAIVDQLIARCEDVNIADDGLNRVLTTVESLNGLYEMREDLEAKLRIDFKSIW